MKVISEAFFYVNYRLVTFVGGIKIGTCRDSFQKKTVESLNGVRWFLHVAELKLIL